MYTHPQEDETRETKIHLVSNVNQTEQAKDRQKSEQERKRGVYQ